MVWPEIATDQPSSPPRVLSVAGEPATVSRAAGVLVVLQLPVVVKTSTVALSVYTVGVPGTSLPAGAPATIVWPSLEIATEKTQLPLGAEG